MKCACTNCDSRNYAFKLYRIVRQFIWNKILKLNEKIENVIYISSFSKEHISFNFPNIKNETLIFNPIDIKEAKKINCIKENKFFLFVGRVDPEKGIERFCQALTNCGENGIVVGDGKLKKELEIKYKNISFVGWKNREEVTEYMMKAKFLVFPSLWYEGAPLTIFEALSIGLPCIVSNVCAGKEFIQNGSNGFLFNPNEKNELEEILRKSKFFDMDSLSDNAFNYYHDVIRKQNYISEIMNFYNKLI